MMAVDLLQWWWTQGWVDFGRRLRQKFVDTLDRFSFGNLFRTLFAPFRQIDAGGTNAKGLSARFQAWLGKTFSRMIGAVIRLFLIIVGALMVVAELVISTVLIILWPLIPFAPVVCVVLAVMGVSL